MSENQVITPEQLEEYMQGLYAKSKVAQKKFEREFTTNRRVDEVLRAIGMKTCEYAEELCTDALNETKMGNVNDKMSKLKGIVFGQWAICKGQNTVDYEDSPLEPGIKILYKPMGVIGCVMPSTNPVATIIGNAMMALATYVGHINIGNTYWYMQAVPELMAIAGNRFEAFGNKLGEVHHG